jgi:D-alanyl-lipoteichoic acid acyltransferase DltB (MBOAT superfamily)
VNYVYGHLTSNPGVPVAFGFYGYPLQMYADFSGLTDIAIGAGVLFGIETPENFKAPFSAVSPADYWRRWHITLTLWLTHYVFTPLRMSLRNIGNTGLVLSLFVNMILIGLWHGFRWTFVLFGIVHAIYLSVDALTQRPRKRFYKQHRIADRVTNWIGPVVTFHLVAVAFVFFRAGNVATVKAFFTHLFAGLTPFSFEFQSILNHPAGSLYFLAAAYLLMECADAVRRRYWSKQMLLALPRWGRWSLYGCTALTVLFTVLLLITSDQKSNPFLYAVF